MAGRRRRGWSLGAGGWPGCTERQRSPELEGAGPRRSRWRRQAWSRERWGSRTRGTWGAGGGLGKEEGLGAAESREKRRGRGRGDRGEKTRWEAALDEDERERRWALPCTRVSWGVGLGRPAQWRGKRPGACWAALSPTLFLISFYLPK